MEPSQKVLDTFKYIKDVLHRNGASVSEYESIQSGIQFDFKLNNTSWKLRLYESKKAGVKVDYSLIRDNEFKSKIIQLIASGGQFTRALPRASNLNIGLPAIGTDESGKGDYFGSLVCAGVYVDEETALKLFASGVADSKKFGDSRNRALAEEIEFICKGQFSIIEISPAKYNDLYVKFKKETKNLNVLLAWAHAKALEEVLGKVKCELAVADQFADERFILNKLQDKGKRIRLVQMPKAEQHIAVAAASILARAKFLLTLERLSLQYGMVFPKGASNLVTGSARLFVKKFGKEELGKVAKLHFKNTNQIEGWI